MSNFVLVGIIGPTNVDFKARIINSLGSNRQISTTPKEGIFFQFLTIVIAKCTGVTNIAHESPPTLTESAAFASQICL